MTAATTRQEAATRPDGRRWAWYAENEPEFLGGESEGSAATTLKRAVTDVD